MPCSNSTYIKDFSAVRTVDINMQVRLLDMGVNIGFDSYDSLTPTLPGSWRTERRHAAFMKEYFAAYALNFCRKSSLSFLMLRSDSWRFILWFAISMTHPAILEQ